MHVFDPHQSHAANVVKNTKSSFNQKILKTFFIFNFILDQKITKKGKINAVVSTLSILILALHLHGGNPDMLTKVNRTKVKSLRTIVPCQAH